MVLMLVRQPSGTGLAALTRGKGTYTPDFVNLTLSISKGQIQFSISFPLTFATIIITNEVVILQKIILLTITK